MADKLTALRVRVESPDRRIRAELSGRDAITVAFADADAYFEYDSEHELATQLSAVLSGTLIGRHDGIRLAVVETTGMTVDDEPHWDAHRRRFRAERDTAESEGISHGGWVTVTAIGLREATVTVKSGVFQECSSPEVFLVEVHSAIADLWTDHGMMMNLLKREYFGNRAG